MITATAPGQAPVAASAPRTNRSSTTGVNVGETERWLSFLAGGALAAYGLRRGSLPGLLTAIAGGGLVYRGLSGHCSVYGSLGVSTARHHPGVAAGRGVKVVQAVTINRSAADLYRFWRDLNNLPRFMNKLESIEVEGNRSRWVMRGPLGMRLRWEAEISHERTNELIAWRSLEGGDLDTAGSVHFTPAPIGRGTEVRVELKVDPPAGQIGTTIAKLFGKDPKSEVREDLRRFKQLMEAGEIATTEGQTSCRH